LRPELSPWRGIPDPLLGPRGRAQRAGDDDDGDSGVVLRCARGDRCRSSYRGAANLV